MARVTLQYLGKNKDLYLLVQQLISSNLKYKQIFELFQLERWKIFIRIRRCYVATRYDLVSSDEDPLGSDTMFSNDMLF